MFSFHSLVGALAIDSISLLASLAIWATVVLGAASGVARGLRGASANVRYCVWQFALLALLALPTMHFILPGVPLGISIPAKPRASDSNSDAPPNRFGSSEADDFKRRAARSILFDQASESHIPQPKTPPVEVASHAALRDSLPVNATATASTAPANSLEIFSMLLFGLWIAGAAIQGIWLLWSMVCAWSLARHAGPLKDERFQRALNDLRQRLSVNRQVRLLKTGRSRLPMVLGAFRSSILLPADCDNWTGERVRIVLSHELIHVQRRDVFWQLLARAVAAIYWIHPLVWLAVCRMRQERERACDDCVLLSGVDATEYAAALVEVAVALSGRWSRIPVGIGMAQGSQLEDRVRSILDASLTRSPASPRARRVILLGMFCIVLILGLLRPFSPLESDAAAPKAAELKSAESNADVKPNVARADVDGNGYRPTRGKIRVNVVDSDDKPLARVGIRTWVLTHEQDSKFKKAQILESGPNGRLDIELPHTLDALQLWATKHGYVSRYKGWIKDSWLEGKPIPEEFTLTMQPGTVIGGIVVDEEGKPISGAQVDVESSLGGFLASGDDLKTDALGRWKLDNMPPGDRAEVRVIASHPDFISIHSLFDIGLERPFPIKQLRAESAVTIMKRGISVTGAITAPGGKPVSGALVIWGSEPYLEARPRQEVLSDERGVYRLPPLPLGPMRVTVVAQGWMPEMRNIEVSERSLAVDFQLKPGKTLRIRLVDTLGDPVNKAYFRIDQWRGAESLYNDDHPNVIDSKIPRHPNKEGIFEWTWAPDDPVTFQISAVGGFSAPKVSFTADDEEHVLKLQPSMRITGHVTDAATGRPIDRFTTVPVVDYDGNLFDIERQHAKEQRKGSYSLGELDNANVAYRVRVEADGYRTAMSDPLRLGGANPTWDFQMQPATAASGRILDGNRPVSGAKVYLATKTQAFERPDDKDQSGDDYHIAADNNYCVATNERGEFSFPAQFEPYKVIVIHDRGYAETALRPDQTPGDIPLSNWARVEGRVLQQGAPVADTSVDLSFLDCIRLGDAPNLKENQIATTDDVGRFVFARVPPKKCMLNADLSPWKEARITSSQHVPLDLQPGQKVALDLGGDGIQVTGRVVLKGVDVKDIDFNWSLNHLLRKTPGIEPPLEVSRLGFDWRSGWNDAWTDTCEGQVYLSTLNNDFVKLRRDGSFSINGVPAGDYEFALRIYEHKDPLACLVTPLAAKVVKFSVTQSDVAKGALELGVIEVDAVVHPKPAETKPPGPGAR
jgi:beta-lactamase regulating signal transducer with metallopeptidase domain